MYEGWTVPIEYDPLLAKLVGYGETRDQAINRLLRALYEYFVGGIKTNISLFRRILKDPDFRAGNIDTGFLDRLLAKPGSETDARRPMIAAIGGGNLRHHGSEGDLAGSERTAAITNGKPASSAASNWRRAARGLRRDMREALKRMAQLAESR